MLKRKITNLIDAWYKNNSSALLIDGARQIGKTTTIENYLKNNNINFIEFNLLQNKLVLEAFNTSYDENQLLLRLSALSNKKLTDAKVIFIDEIQEANDAITPIKFLVKNTNYKFIFSGSLLGVKMQEILSIPIGYLTTIRMYPMDFEEFSLAVGVSTNTFDYLSECFSKKTIIDDIIHKQMSNLFNTYLVVGGMPKAVDTFIKSNDINEVNQVLAEIDEGYKHDISKYQKDKKLLIQDIYDLIPSELNSQNKRFVLKNLNEKARFYKYETSFVWLKNSRVGLFAHNVDNPIYPLLASKERTLFKLFLSDVGLLTFKLFKGNQIELLNNGSNLNYGAVYENVVAQELTAHGFDLYYNTSKKRGEIDFLIEKNNQVIPIEIKSGKDYKRHSSLSNLLSNNELNYKEAYVFCNDNVLVDGKIVYLPIYLISFIKNGADNKPKLLNLDISKLI